MIYGEQVSLHKTPAFALADFSCLAWNDREINKGSILASGWSLDIHTDGDCLAGGIGDRSHLVAVWRVYSKRHMHRNLRSTCRFGFFVGFGSQLKKFLVCIGCSTVRISELQAVLVLEFINLLIFFSKVLV